MFAFSCSHCGMKFQVKPEFAGRATRCPTCKQPLVVPLEATLATTPRLSNLDGLLSSLARAGIAGDITLAAQQPSDRADAPPSVAEVLRTRQAKGQRYLLEGEIARGGMGAVLRAIDCDIRREVAVKFLLDQTDPRKTARFVEEAQITGQLEHSNIVPIHELGVDARNLLFFSMKMVKGRSLQQVLQQLHDEPRSAEKEYSLGRLLNIFVSVCHALAYAHSRGVVHRDLKPANIMIGDFGEVYVMDWGLAKVLKDGERGRFSRPECERFSAARRGPARHARGDQPRAGRGFDAGRDGHGHGGVHAAGAGRRPSPRRRSTQRRVRAGGDSVRDARLAAADRQGGRLPGDPPARDARADRAAGAREPSPSASGQDTA